VIGTRPEAIKLAPVVRAARADPRFEARVVTTSQHREMLDPMLAEFEIAPDVDLAIMKHDQDPAQITVAALAGLDAALARLAPDCVVVQGDTTSTLAGALAAFYRGARVAHVEAGLRTGDTARPWPEEMNRRLTAQLSDYHFAPTEIARRNLLREGVDAARIWVTGNTAIDALLWTVERARRRGAPGAGRSGGAPDAGPLRTLLVTAHRRESHGAPLARICAALRELVEEIPDLRVRYPVHLSPRVRETVMVRLAGHPRIELTEPLGYTDFVLAMQRAHVLLTDSGGVQEEAPSLGRPVLVLRDTSERPEAIEAGSARLVGTDPRVIVSEVRRLFEDEAHYRRMASAVNPYGDGKAAGRILEALALRVEAGRQKPAGAV
jgi:UDP-N-acetylglucosamine 2-epimerase